VDGSASATDAAEIRTRQFERLFEFAPDAIIAVDAQGKIVLVNEETERMLGYLRDELLGQPVELLVPERVQARHAVHRADYVAHPRRRPPGTGMELNARHKDGSEVPVDISLGPLDTDEGVLIVSVLRDVSERREAERRIARQADELIRSNAELEQFAYVASHDLQEPLRMVASYTQLLARRYGNDLDDDAREFIRYAVDGATRMQRLINDLLAYSRVGTQGSPPEPVDGDAVLGRTLDDVREALAESQATVTHDPLPTVRADGDQLGQLFQNLITNAVKFCGDTPPKVHVSAERRDGEWYFFVRDEGIGIDPEYAERIFVIFQRLHTRSEHPGTGIGLAVCKKIVERHGGRIWVESSPGAGSTFVFTIPATDAGQRAA